MPERDEVTAADLMRRLESDTHWERQRSERERVHRELSDENCRAAEPILRAIGEATGVHSRSITALKEVFVPEMLDTLVEWLPKIDNLAVKASIVALFETEWSGPEIAVALIRELRSSVSYDSIGMSVEGYQWVVAATLSEISYSANVSDLLDIFEEGRFGRARQMLAIALGRVGAAEGVTALIAALSDSEVNGHAAIALGMLRAREATDNLIALEQDERAWVRREARRALALIDSGV